MKAQLDQILAMMGDGPLDRSSNGLVIDGKALSYALNAKLAPLFLRVRLVVMHCSAAFAAVLCGFALNAKLALLFLRVRLSLVHTGVTFGVVCCFAWLLGAHQRPVPTTIFAHVPLSALRNRPTPSPF